MKNLILRLLILFATAAFFVLSFSGCGTSANPDQEKNAPVAIALVIGNHANALKLNLENPDLTNFVTQAITTQGFISIICADGAPCIFSTDEYPVPPEDQGNEQMVKIAQKQAAENVKGTLKEITAKSPELDTLSALNQAVRSLSEAPKESICYIIVMDTGLSTTGELDFRNNYLSADPESIATMLNDRQAIPDFNGITVIWEQMGDVTSPQPVLTPAHVKNLKDIWSAIIKKTGGEANISNIPPLQNEVDAKMYPSISIVEPPPAPPIKLSVQFLGQSDKYIDETETIATLTPVAENIIANPKSQWLLVGSTADSDGDENFCMTLSKNRAYAVRNTLVSLGVPANQLTAIGLGSHAPWFITDKDSSGKLIESIAAQNRIVFLMSADSEDAEGILRAQGK